MHPRQISDLVRGGMGQNSQNTNKIKKKKKKKKNALPNRNIEGKMKIDNIGSTNNNKVEGLTHHVLSSSTKISSKITFPFCSVIQILLTKISIPQFFETHLNLLEYLFWIFSILFVASAENAV